MVKYDWDDWKIDRVILYQDFLFNWDGKKF